MATEIRVPTLGESVTEATVATWFKKPGDSVAVDEMLCELETDKVPVEEPSPSAGTLGEIVAAEGDTVGVDALLAILSEGEGEAPAPEKKADPKSEAEAEPEAKAAPSGGKSSGESIEVMVPTLGERVTEAIDPLRREKVTRSSNEAFVTVPASAVPAGVSDEQLAELFITGTVTRHDKDEVIVTKSTDRKCGRCWRLLPDVAEDGALCGRCTTVVREWDARALAL